MLLCKVQSTTVYLPGTSKPPMAVYVVIIAIVSVTISVVNDSSARYLADSIETSRPHWFRPMRTCSAFEAGVRDWSEYSRIRSMLLVIVQ